MSRKKCIFSSLILLMMILILSLSSIHANADGIGGGTGNGGGLGNEIATDPNASASGVSKNRSGYLVYLADKDTGAVTSPVWLVPYNSAPASSVNIDYLESRLGGIWGSSIRIYSGNISTATNGEFSNPPFTVEGYAFGADLKSKLLEMNGDHMKAYDFILNVLGQSYCDQFHDNDERLVIEAVAWTGFVSGGDLYAYTPYTGAVVSNTYNYNYLHGFKKEKFPKCAYLEYTWCGVPAPTVPSGAIAYSEIISQGYGLIMIAPQGTPDGGGGEEQPVEVSTDDYLKADELNYVFPDFIKSSTDGREMFVLYGNQDLFQQKHLQQVKPYFQVYRINQRQPVNPNLQSKFLAVKGLTGFCG